jgi:hypothetical protein
MPPEVSVFDLFADDGSAKMSNFRERPIRHALFSTEKHGPGADLCRKLLSGKNGNRLVLPRRIEVVG